MRRIDENIKKDVVDQLYWDNRVNVANIKINVQAGEVIMDGTVPTYSARNAVVQDVKMIEGVTRIKNRLVVTPPAFSARLGDQEVEKRIRTALAWNADIHSMDIEVSMKDRTAILTGVVDEYWKKWKAEEIALEVNGVVNVENSLTIVTTKNFWDKDIAKGIEHALRRNAEINAQNITVQVERGKVILTGIVPSWFAHSEAERCAAHTAGVVDVENKIIVEHHKMVQDYDNNVPSRDLQ